MFYVNIKRNATLLLYTPCGLSIYWLTLNVNTLYQSASQIS